MEAKAVQAVEDFVMSLVHDMVNATRAQVKDGHEIQKVAHPRENCNLSFRAPETPETVYP
eukprot:4279920-Amphidinium_carterae.1